MSGVKGRSGGHNRKTLGEHELAGTYRRDRHGHFVPDEGIPGEPAKPTYLCDVASGKWDDLTKLLRDERRLYVSDGEQIETAANLYAAAVKWQALSDTSPLINESGRAQECHVQTRLAWDAYRKAIVELGLTQTSRSRAATPRKEDSGEASSPLARLQARAQIIRRFPEAVKTCP